MDSAKSTVGHDDNEIAGLMFTNDGRYDVVERSGVPRPLAAAGEIVNELRNGQPLRIGERRSEHGRYQDLARGAERPGEILLEDAAT